MSVVATRRPTGVTSPRTEFFPSLRDEMERYFSEFWNGEPGWVGMPAPALDLSETDKTVEVRLDIPGMKAKDLSINLSQNVLTVSGERSEEKEEKGKKYLRVERKSGAFSRSFTLPCPVEEDEVAAEYKDGVLTITLPKTEKAKTRRIDVKG